MNDTPDGTASLTQAEAEERGALLSVRRYDIAVDLTGLLEGDTVESVATIAFACERPRSCDVRRLRRGDPARHVERTPAGSRHGRARPAAAARPPPRTCSSSRRPSPTPPARPASCAPSTRATSWSMSGCPSRPTTPAGCGRALTSRI
ncbi:MAG: hypothetical protein R2734_01755 [Nocardioides sp.]